MGEITRTVVLHVPSNIVYKAIKEHFIRKWIRTYCPDLIRGTFVQDIAVDYSLLKDIENSELVFTASKLGSRTEEKFTISPIEEGKCEVTFNLRYRLLFDSDARAFFIQVISCLLMFERGYKSK